MLRLVKLTPKQTQLVSEALVYFHGLAERAPKTAQFKRSGGVVPIPLQKLYDQWKCNSKDKQALKVVANVYFEQRFRGNHKTRQCSGWMIREQPHVNDQMKRTIFDLMNENAEHLKELDTFVHTKEQNTLVIQSKFRFNSDDQMRTFKGLLETIEIKEAWEEDPGTLLQLQNHAGYTLQHALNAQHKKWREGDEKWPVATGLARQAKTYGITVEQLHAAIKSSKALHEKFSQYPESGYLGSTQIIDEEAPF